jgi:hypothetical protein
MVTAITGSVSTIRGTASLHAIWPLDVSVASVDSGTKKLLTRNATTSHPTARSHRRRYRCPNPVTATPRTAASHGRFFDRSWPMTDYTFSQHSVFCSVSISSCKLSVYTASISLSIERRRLMRCSVEGCVLNSRPTTPLFNGIMKNAFISLCSRRSRSGTRSIRPSIFMSADASAEGWPVMIAPPRSAVNSRYRDSTRVNRNETTQTPPRARARGAGSGSFFVALFGGFFGGIGLLLMIMILLPLAGMAFLWQILSS